jgi:hypothetical protein
MIIARTPPFLKPPGDSVKPTPWRMVVQGQDPFLANVLPEWEPGTDLHLVRTAVVDPALVRRASGLPEDAVLRMGVAWHCTGTTLRGRGTVVTLPTSGEVRIPLELRIQGRDLAGSLRVRSMLVLGGRLPPAPLRARRPGTLLWEDIHDVVLEGGGARFPMEVISFSQSSWRLPNHAAWALEWDREDLELPLLGALRLYLNADHPAVSAALAKPTDPASTTLIAALHHDVARQLVVGALLSDEFVERTEKWPAESVGEVIHKLLSNRFKGDSPQDLRERLRQEPSQFEATLQDHLRAFWSSEE